VGAQIAKHPKTTTKNTSKKEELNPLEILKNQTSKTP
jgi:hypothetical protein